LVRELYVYMFEVT